MPTARHTTPRTIVPPPAPAASQKTECQRLNIQWHASRREASSDGQCQWPVASEVCWDVHGTTPDHSRDRWEVNAAVNLTPQWVVELALKKIHPIDRSIPNSNTGIHSILMQT